MPEPRPDPRDRRFGAHARRDGDVLDAMVRRGTGI